MGKRCVCTKDCPDTCGMLVRVKNGRITAVKGDPEHPYTRGFISRKAKYFPEHAHSAERILEPLKRTGPKGSDRFSPIGWDDALAETAAARNIADGHCVRVYNDRGECYLTAMVTQDTQPGLLVAEGLRAPPFHGAGKGVNQLTSQRLTDAGQTCAFHCNRVEVEPK